MGTPRLDDQILREAVVAVEEADSNITEAARTLGINRSTLQTRLRYARERLGIAPGKLSGGSIGVREQVVKSLPKRGEVKRYILTSAQNNTKVHDGWFNLLALAEHYDAEIYVGTFSYNKNSYQSHAAKWKSGQGSDQDEMWYDPELVPYIHDERVQLAPGLVWCGEMNILPTAHDPLRGFETYCGRQSIVIPHAKIALASVPSGKNEATKFTYSTGTVTLRNYIQKRAGLRAEFHHNYGALIVEVDSNGSWFVRQLHIDDQDAIYDLNLKAQAGMVQKGEFVEAIAWGDVHRRKLNKTVRELAWGPEGMIDTLRPRKQFIHDVLDFRGRNHHDRSNPHRMFEYYKQGWDDVEGEVREVVHFLEKECYRDFCETYVVNSNHDDALTRWLRECDYRADPVNALFFLRMQLATYEAIADRDTSYHMLEKACGLCDLDATKAVFLREDESFVLLPELNGGVEMGMHGHLGPNGARGSARSLVKYGRRAVIMHSHTAEIRDGITQGGTSSDLDLGYNRGPSSWSWSHVLVYENGSTAIVTMWNNKWRA
jgi:transposase-like protein